MAPHRVVWLGGFHDVAGVECLAAMASHVVFGALVANPHAARADWGWRLVGQVSLGWRVTPVGEYAVS